MVAVGLALNLVTLESWHATASKVTGKTDQRIAHARMKGECTCREVTLQAMNTAAIRD